MKSWYSCLFILLAFIFYHQSTKAYPLSPPQEHRTFLRCLLSPVACKRSLSNADEIENVSQMDIADYLHMCMAFHQPLRLCLDQPLHKNNRLIK